jgi:hypothetical protein
MSFEYDSDSVLPVKMGPMMGMSAMANGRRVSSAEDERLMTAANFLSPKFRSMDDFASLRP